MDVWKWYFTRRITQKWKSSGWMMNNCKGIFFPVITLVAKKKKNQNKIKWWGWSGKMGHKVLINKFL